MFIYVRVCVTKRYPASHHIFLGKQSLGTQTQYDSVTFSVGFPHLSVHILLEIVAKIGSP